MLEEELVDEILKLYEDNLYYDLNDKKKKLIIMLNEFKNLLSKEQLSEFNELKICYLSYEKRLKTSIIEEAVEFFKNKRRS